MDVYTTEPVVCMHDLDRHSTNISPVVLCQDQHASTRLAAALHSHPFSHASNTTLICVSMIISSSARAAGLQFAELQSTKITAPNLAPAPRRMTHDPSFLLVDCAGILPYSHYTAVHQLVRSGMACLHQLADSTFLRLAVPMLWTIHILSTLINGHNSVTIATDTL